MFKKGDKVVYATEGPIGWEDIDWAKEYGLIVGEVYTVSESSMCHGEPVVKIEEAMCGYYIHPGHFKLYNGEKKMTKVTVFGQEEAKKEEKKAIELVKYANSHESLITDAANEHKKEEIKEIVHLGRAENGMDWIMVIPYNTRFRYIYLGHWNDGVV